MRRATSKAKAFAWWREALAGKKPPITHNEPQCGYFKRRLIAKGPFVPCSILLHAETDSEGNLLSDEVMVCEVNGDVRDVRDEWTWLAGRPISQETYMEMLAERFAKKPPAPESDLQPQEAPHERDTPY